MRRTIAILTALLFLAIAGVSTSASVRQDTVGRFALEASS